MHLVNSEFSLSSSISSGLTSFNFESKRLQCMSARSILILRSSQHSRLSAILNFMRSKFFKYLTDNIVHIIYYLKEYFPLVESTTHENLSDSPIHSKHSKYSTFCDSSSCETFFSDSNSVRSSCNFYTNNSQVPVISKLTNQIRAKLSTDTDCTQLIFQY